MQLLASIPYQQLPFHNHLVKDYLNGKKDLRDFYSYEPNVKGLLEAAKHRDFDLSSRKILADDLTIQYSGLPILNSVIRNIEKLRSDNSFTITTGHQLCIYASPAYFIYKIASVINLAKQLQSAD